MIVPTPRPLEIKKKETRQRANAHVESPLEIFIGREDIRPMKERDDCHTQYDHRERQAVVELDEPHAIAVCLSGRTDEGDRG